MSEERLNTFRTFEKKMKDGSIVVCCKSSIESKEVIEQLQESLRGKPVHMIFDKPHEEVKAEIRKQHLEMVLNRDFKPMYVNVGLLQNKQLVVQTVLSVMEESKNG